MVFDFLVPKAEAEGPGIWSIALSQGWASKYEQRNAGNEDYGKVAWGYPSGHAPSERYLLRRAHGIAWHDKHSACNHHLVLQSGCCKQGHLKANTGVGRGVPQRACATRILAKLEWTWSYDLRQNYSKSSLELFLQTSQWRQWPMVTTLFLFLFVDSVFCLWFCHCVLASWGFFKVARCPVLFRLYSEKPRCP